MLMVCPNEIAPHCLYPSIICPRAEPQAPAKRSPYPSIKIDPDLATSPSNPNARDFSVVKTNHLISQTSIANVNQVACYS